MIKIVFLDIDGVLNSHNYFLSRPSPKDYDHSSMLDPVAMQRLNRLLKATDAVVVISSSWRNGHNVEQLDDLLRSRGFAGRIIGMTATDSDVPTRGGEIQAWLSLHPTVESFVILDDDRDSENLSNRWVQTTFMNGLQDNHVDKAIELLQQKENEVMTPYEMSRRAFDGELGNVSTFLVLHPDVDPYVVARMVLKELQTKLNAWAKAKFKNVDSDEAVNTMGVSEEIGELAEALENWMGTVDVVMNSISCFFKIVAASGKVTHAVLKHIQGIRGYDNRDKAAAEVGDGIADIFVYGTQLLTNFRLDAGTIFFETAKKVMKRDWTNHPVDADVHVVE